MARIRTIKPEFWADEVVGALSPYARLLFLASWNIADDEGLLVWTPAFLRAQAFAYDDLSIDAVKSAMNEIEKVGRIFPYKDAKGQSFGWIVNFRKHQRIDKPQSAKHPFPSLQNPEVKKLYGARDNWRCYICNKDIPETTENRFECLSLDHFQAQSKNGTDAPSNIRATHFGCNSSKKDTVFQDDKATIPGAVQELSATEGKGKELNGKEGNGTRERAVELRVAVVRAFEAANSPNLPDTSRAELWLSQGFDPAIIVATIRTILARNPGISSLNYFDTAIREAHQNRAPPRPKPKEIDWDARVKTYREREIWPHDIGPEPGYGGCRAPVEILRKYGYGEQAA